MGGQTLEVTVQCSSTVQVWLQSGEREIDRWFARQYQCRASERSISRIIDRNVSQY